MRARVAPTPEIGSVAVRTVRAVRDTWGSRTAPRGGPLARSPSTDTARTRNGPRAPSTTRLGRNATEAEPRCMRPLRARARSGCGLGVVRRAACAGTASSASGSPTPFALSTKHLEIIDSEQRGTHCVLNKIERRNYRESGMMCLV